MAEFELTILGSNSAVPAHNRHPSAQFLKHHQTGILIDCGEGTQFQMNKYHIKRGHLNHILISHLHGDHYFGLVGLINSFRLNNRQHDLNIYGPPDLEQIIALQANHTDLDWPYRIRFQALRFEEVYTLFETDDFVVTTIPLKHKIPCSGFLIREKIKARKIVSDAIRQHGIPHQEISAIKRGGDYIKEDGSVIQNALLTANPPPSYSYAYCSDTLYDEELIPLIKDVDVLYHEATFKEDSKEKAALRFHSTAKEAASIAKQANVKQLIVGHYSAKYKDLGELLAEAQEVFPNTALAIEGNSYEIKS